MADLNANFILQGQSPDVLGQLNRGATAAQFQNQIGQENALASLYRSQGAGIANGDPNALAALAAIDPKAAMSAQQTQLGMQSDRQNMAATQQKMDMLTREERRTIEDRAASMSAAERDAAAKAIEGAVRMGMTAQSPQQWDAMMGQMGSPDLVGQFDNRQGIAAKYMTMADVIKMTAPPDNTVKFRPATQAEAAQYGAASGQIGADGRFYPINPPSGMSVETGPDGQVRVVQGPGAGGPSGKPFTEAQSKDVTFATKAEGALRTLDPLAGELTSLSSRAAESDPTGFIRGQVQSDKYQVAKIAGDEFLQAILRKESGAAITPQEQALYGITYLPQPGDSEAVMGYKAEARKRAVDAIKAGMSPDQILAREKALGPDPNAPAGGSKVLHFDAQGNLIK